MSLRVVVDVQVVCDWEDMDEEAEDGVGERCWKSARYNVTSGHDLASLKMTPPFPGFDGERAADHFMRNGWKFVVSQTGPIRHYCPDHAEEA